MMFRGKGVLWSDNMEYVTFIKNEEIDNELLGLILESYLKEEVEFAKEVLEDIIASQLEYETNRNIIEQWIEDGGIEVKEAIMDIIEKVENDEWSDRFHY
jgi:Glu-tRNA(Gln) amidotransferase subunit E-like FAD-binding protein